MYLLLCFQWIFCSLALFSFYRVFTACAVKSTVSLCLISCRLLGSLRYTGLSSLTLVPKYGSGNNCSALLLECLQSINRWVFRTNLKNFLNMFCYFVCRRHLHGLFSAVNLIELSEILWLNVSIFFFFVVSSKLRSNLQNMNYLFISFFGFFDDIKSSV